MTLPTPRPRSAGMNRSSRSARIERQHAQCVAHAKGALTERFDEVRHDFAAWSCETPKLIDAETSATTCTGMPARCRFTRTSQSPRRSRRLARKSRRRGSGRSYRLMCETNSWPAPRLDPGMRTGPLAADAIRQAVVKLLRQQSSLARRRDFFEDLRHQRIGDLRAAQLVDRREEDRGAATPARRCRGCRLASHELRPASQATTRAARISAIMPRGLAPARISFSMSTPSMRTPNFCGDWLASHRSIT